MRGQKICAHCGAKTGPRAFSCPSCNKPFMIKGKEATPEQIAQAKLAKIPTKEREDGEAVEDEIFLESSDYFNIVKPTERELSNQGVQVHVWESKDGRYRLRWSKEFMGVSIENLHGRPYCLLKHIRAVDGLPALEMVRRFKGMQGALKTYVKILNGIPIERPKEDVRKKQTKKMKRILKGINK